MKFTASGPGRAIAVAWAARPVSF